MKALFLAGMLAVAGVSAAPAAAATLDFGANGPSSIDFGNTSRASGSFTDSYTFNVVDGVVNSFVSSLRLSSALDVALTSVKFDDISFDQLSTGALDYWLLNDTQLTAGTHTLTVAGTWGTSGGSYAGTVNFVPTSAVPEPASWALMIGGVGLAGGTLRASRRRATVAA